MRLCAAAGVMAGTLFVSGPAAAGPDVYPLSKVRRGMTGYGLTTFAGTKPERFSFEVISVVHNMLPKQDIVLIKSNDPKMKLTGVWRGMSGSPLFIDDKMMCAVSYAWSFNKIAMGGCTPIAYMKKASETYRRGAPDAPISTKAIKGRKLKSPVGPGNRPKMKPTRGAAIRYIQPSVASRADWRRVAPTGDLGDALARLGPRHQNWLASAPLPVPVKRSANYDGQAMTASVPLAVAGFSAPAFAELGKMFAGSTLVPVRAGGTGAMPNERGPKKFTPGGPIAIPVIRGDMSAAASGTVTFLDRQKVLAFGHPMFGNGEWYAPVSTAYVHTVIASMQSAFHMTSPLNEIGSLVEDRQAAIMADTSLRSRMIPVNISVRTTHGKQVTSGEFHVDILDNKFLTAPIAGAAVMNAINYYLPDREDVTARIDSTVRIAGTAPINFVDYIYAHDGAASAMGSVRGLRVLVPLINNPFEPIKIDRIDLKVDLRYEINFGSIKEIRVPTTDFHVGRNTVDVSLKTYDGNDFVEHVPVDVPENLAGSIVQLEVAAGDAAKLDAAPPVDLKSLLEAVHRMLPGNVWAISLYPAEDGVALDGKLVRDLPATAQDKLHPQSHTARAQAYKPVARTISPARRVIDGKATLLVRVRDR